MRFRTRFAPSPTGLLHVGHAFSALTAHGAARAASGEFLLRIEDIDSGRCRPEFEAAILEDLAWLGISWDGPVVRQSERMAAYGAALETLIARGLVYRCFKTRKEIAAAALSAPHGAEPAFFGAPDPDEAARLARAEPFAWRLSMAAAERALGADFAALMVSDETGVRPADPRKHGDVVLARKDAPASYHLASVWDDADAGVTHVIRGEDLRDAADLHVLLQALLGLPHPDYCHHRLILGKDGQRLAKRDRAETLASLREGGATPADIRAKLGLAAA